MTKRIGFFVPQQVSLLGLDCALDTLRVANRVLGEDFYHWCTIGEADLAVQTSNALRLVLDYTTQQNLPDLDMLFVCGSVDPAQSNSAQAVRWLRHMAQQVPILGGITSGAFLLARAGLLDGYTCTLHWEDADRFRQEFPDIRVTDSVFVIDRDRMTSAGGLLTIDLLLQVISADCGAATTLSVLSAFQKDRMRSPTDPQTWSLARSSRLHPRQILKAVHLMEQNIETPLEIEAIARGAGVSARHLSRLFQLHFDQTSSEYYRSMRLKRAQRLLRTTSLSVSEVANACGFAAQSSFARSFLRTFGHTPSKSRQPQRS